MTTVACFVSPHGFGHAARTCAVIDALVRRHRHMRFHVFTTVPEWFFSESLPDCFEYHLCCADIGLVQESPLKEDVGATARALDAAPWRNTSSVERLARRLGQLGCSLVIADISPLGLCVARRAGLPSVLVENFTWDWIYERIDGSDELKSHGDDLSSIFATADLRIQTHPVCQTVAGAVPVGPVARASRCPRAEVRGRLGIPGDDPMVLASMGGLGWNYPCLDGLTGGDGVWIVVPGGADLQSRRGRLLLLPFHSSFFHPDLVSASDVVVGKLGYSTVAEVCRAGTRLAFLERPLFPESSVLSSFVRRHLTSVKLEQEAFERGDWLPVIRELLGVGRKASVVAADGAAETSAAIVHRFPEVST